jgi:hypothetical protein
MTRVRRSGCHGTSTVPKASRHDAIAYHAAVIERVVLIKLKPAFATDEHRAEIAATTTTTLPEAEGVRALRIGTPADGRTRRDWDLCLQVVLDDVDAVERYRVDPVHRAYADEYLKPMMQKIHVFNFERFEPAP